MELSKRTTRGKPSKADRIPKVGKGEGGLDRFRKQIQKNKLDSEESDIETEKVTDGSEGEKIGKITAI